LPPEGGTRSKLTVDEEMGLSEIAELAGKIEERTR